MAQFRYRLQTLLDQKIQAKEDAQHGLAAAQRELKREQEELASCRREEEARADKLRAAQAERVLSAAGAWLVLKRDYLARLKDKCEEASDATRAQELQVSEAEQRVTTARETLAAASRDLEVLEKHRERLERRFNDEAKRKEALNQEEMANVIFLQGRKAT